MKKLSALLLVLSAALLLICGCGKESGGFSFIDIPSDGLILPIAMGGYQVDYTGTAEWVSDNESVATVNQDGYITLVAPGTATITAFDSNGGAHSFLLEVVGVSLDGFSISKTSLDAYAGREYQITISNIQPSEYSAKYVAVRLTPQDGILTVTRSNSNPEIVNLKVSEDITDGAKYKLDFIGGNITKTCNITTRVAKLNSLSMSVDDCPNSFLFKDESSVTLRVSANPSGLFPIEIKTDEYIKATPLGSSGNAWSLKAIKGSAWSTITATCGGVTETMELLAIDTDNLNLIASDYTSGNNSETKSPNTKSILGTSVSLLPGQPKVFTFSMNDGRVWKNCEAPYYIIEKALQWAYFSYPDPKNSWFPVLADKTLELRSCYGLGNDYSPSQYQIRALKTGTKIFKYQTVNGSSSNFTVNSQYGSISVCCSADHEFDSTSDVREYAKVTGNGSSIEVSLQRSQLPYLSKTNATYFYFYINVGNAYNSDTSRRLYFNAPTTNPKGIMFNSGKDFMALDKDYYTTFDKTIALHSADKDGTNDIITNIRLIIE